MVYSNSNSDKNSTNDRKIEPILPGGAHRCPCLNSAARVAITPITKNASLFKPSSPARPSAVTRSSTAADHCRTAEQAQTRSRTRTTQNGRFEAAHVTLDGMHATTVSKKCNHKRGASVSLCGEVLSTSS